MFTIWLQPILAAIIKNSSIVFTLAGRRLHADELTDGAGYGAVLGFLINLHQPGAVPLQRSKSSPCGWIARFEDSELPVSIISAIALDVALVLSKEATDDTLAVDPMIFWMQEALSVSESLSSFDSGST